MKRRCSIPLLRIKDVLGLSKTSASKGLKRNQLVFVTILMRCSILQNHDVWFSNELPSKGVLGHPRTSANKGLKVYTRKLSIVVTLLIRCNIRQVHRRQFCRVLISQDIVGPLRTFASEGPKINGNEILF